MPNGSRQSKFLEVAHGDAPGDILLEGGRVMEVFSGRVIKTNVLIQCDNLRTYSCVAERERAGELSIHAWLYDLHTGEISEYREHSDSWEAVAHAS